MGIETGHRVGGFLILVDSEGCRHAVRLAAIQCLSDTDPCADATLMILPGGRQVTIPRRLDDVLGWVSTPAP
jgi:hypothetical protein